MRLTGAALLMAAGLLTGLRMADRLQKRCALRTELERMLALMAFELGRFRTPLPQLFEKLSAGLEGEALTLCCRMTSGLDRLGERTLDGIWAEALEPLPPPERKILLPLGNVLGRYGAEEQLRAVESCRAAMERSQCEAQAALRERGRMYVGLSAAGAAVLVVLLL